MFTKGKIILLIIISLLCGCNRSHSTYQGYIEGKYTYVASAVSGNLAQLLVKRGDQVKPKQILFVLDPEPETSKLKQTEKRLAEAEQILTNLQKGQRTTILTALKAQKTQAEAALDFAQRTLNRDEPLRRQGVIDQATLDQARSVYKQSLDKVKEIDANLAEAKLGARENLIAAQASAVEALRASVQEAHWAIEQKTVRAQVAAQVFDTLYEPNEFVATSRPVISLLPPDKMKVIFFVPEKIVSKLHVGDHITFGCDSCITNYSANISFISPSAEYTPPVIYSESSRDKLVYRIEANLKPEIAINVHPGQPVDVKTINNEE